MNKLILIAVVFLSSVASAESVKTGTSSSIVHGCANDRAAKRLEKFINKDPKFTFDNEAHTATLTIVEKLANGGIHEMVWPSSENSKVKVVWIDTDKADFFLPPDEDNHMQTHIMVDAGPFVTPTTQHSSNKRKFATDRATMAKPQIRVDIIIDYTPEDTASGKFAHISRCSESWNGTAVWL